MPLCFCSFSCDGGEGLSTSHLVISVVRRNPGNLCLPPFFPLLPLLPHSRPAASSGKPKMGKQQHVLWGLGSCLGGFPIQGSTSQDETMNGPLSTAKLVAVRARIGDARALPFAASLPPRFVAPQPVATSLLHLISTRTGRKGRLTRVWQSSRSEAIRPPW